MIYPSILFITLLIIIIAYGYIAFSYQLNKKRLENVNNIM